jgi:flagellar basal body-associated protein FliL
MFDHINQHQEKLFNLSKLILIVVALLMSITVIYFMFFYKNNEIAKGSVSSTQVEAVELLYEP